MCNYFLHSGELASYSEFLPIILGGPDFHTLLAGKDDMAAGGEGPMAPKGLFVDVDIAVVGLSVAIG